MSQFRQGLAESEGKTVTIVGRASKWKKMKGCEWLCIDHLFVDAGAGLAFEENHVHLKLSIEDRRQIHVGDWVEVQGPVYRYYSFTDSGVRCENCSIKPDASTVLWRRSVSYSDEVAYCYAHEVDLVRSLRTGPIAELDEHFSTNSEFDPLFSIHVEYSDHKVPHWVGPGESLWFYRITVDGPFIDWNSYKTNPACRPKAFRRRSSLKSLYDSLVAVGSRPREWRFSLSPVGPNRWLAIEPMKPIEGRIRHGRRILQVL